MPLNSGAALLMTLLPAALFLTFNYIGDTGNEAGSGGNIVQNNTNFTINLRPTYTKGDNGSLLGQRDSKSIDKSNFSVSSNNDSFNRGSIIENVIVSDIKSSSVVKKSVVSTQEGSSFKGPVLPTCCDIKVKTEGGKQILGYCDTDGKSTGEGTDFIWNVPKQLLFREEESKQFRLEKRRPTCKSGNMFTGKRSLSVISLAATNKETGEVEGDHFLSQGILKFQNEYYRPDEYCVNGLKDDQLEIHICKPNCSDPETPCVQKCCAYDEVYSLGMNGKRGGCLPLDPKKNETIWSPVFYQELNKKLSPEESKKLRPHIIHKNPSSFKPECKNKITIVYPYGQDISEFLNRVLRRPFFHLQFQLRKDGWLIHPNSTSTDIAIMKSSRTTKYCIDGVQNYGESEKFSNKETQTVLFVCTMPDPEIVVAKDDSKPYDKLIVSSSMSVSTTVSSPGPTPEEKKVTLPSTTTSTTTTTTTTTTSTTTTTTTTPRPVIIPKLPTCCNLKPASSLHGDKVGHYCMNVGAEGLSSTDASTPEEWVAAPKFMHTNKLQKFMLETQPLKCKLNWNKAFILNYPNLPGGGSPSFMPNGMLKFQNEYFRPGEYCVNGIFSSIVEVLMCKTNCSSPETPCINKCCGPNEVYSLGVGGKKRGCIPLHPSDTPWTPNLYTDMFNKVSENELKTIRPHLVQKFPPKFQYNCFKNVTLVFPYMKEVVSLMSPLAKISLEFRLRKDGKVMYRHPVIKDSSGKLMESVFNNVEYCVDGIRHFGEVESGSYQSRDDQTVLFVCAMNPPPPVTMTPLSG